MYSVQPPPHPKKILKLYAQLYILPQCCEPLLNQNNPVWLVFFTTLKKTLKSVTPNQSVTVIGTVQMALIVQDWPGTSLRLWSPPSHSMWGFTRASMGLQGAPARLNASSTSRPHSRRVFRAATQTFLEPHAVMRHVQRGLFSCPNLLLISPMRTANSFMQIWQQKDELIRQHLEFCRCLHFSLGETGIALDVDTKSNSRNLIHKSTVVIFSYNNLILRCFLTQLTKFQPFTLKLQGLNDI